MTKYFKGFSFVLAVVFTLVIWLSIAGAIVVARNASLHSRLEDIDRELIHIFESIQRSYIVHPGRTFLFFETIASKVSAQSPENPHKIYLLTSITGQKIYGNIEELPTSGFDDEGIVDFDLPGNETRHAVRARAIRLNDQFILLVGRNVSELREFVFDVLMWGTIIATFVALGVAYLFTNLISRRLQVFNNTSEAVLTGNFGERIKRNRSGDNFDQLAENINNMLERIDFQVGHLRKVSNKIEHNILSPLYRLKEQLVHSANLDDEEKSQLLSEVGLIDSAVGVVVSVAEFENKISEEEHSKFNPIEVIDKLYRDHLEMAENKKIKLNYVLEAERIEIPGYQNAIYLALENLLKNAIKYSPKEGTVKVAGISKPEGFEFVITDTGPGIPPEKHEEVRKLNFRLDRDKLMPGEGLGLYCVDEVAKRHNVELKFEKTHPDDQNNPGLKATLGYFRQYKAAATARTSLENTK